MLKKRSIVIAGHATSVTMEEAFWEALKTIAEARGQSLNHLAAEVDAARADGENLSSALRVFILTEVGKD